MAGTTANIIIQFKFTQDITVCQGRRQDFTFAAPVQTCDPMQLSSRTFDKSLLSQESIFSHKERRKTWILSLI